MTEAQLLLQGPQFLMQGLSTGLGMYGSQYSGEVAAYNAGVESENKARAEEAQAIADTFNAKVSRQLAESETKQAAGKAADYRRAGSAALASRRARAASENLALEGSPLLVDESIFQEIDFGTQRIAHAGGVASTRYRNQAELLDYTSAIHTDNASRARATGAQNISNIRGAANLNTAGIVIKGLMDGYKTLSGRSSPSSWAGGSSSGPMDIRSSFDRGGWA